MMPSVAAAVSAAVRLVVVPNREAELVPRAWLEREPPQIREHH